MGIGARKSKIDRENIKATSGQEIVGRSKLVDVIAQFFFFTFLESDAKNDLYFFIVSGMVSSLFLNYIP